MPCQRSVGMGEMAFEQPVWRHNPSEFDLSTFISTFMPSIAIQHAQAIFQAASPVLRIHAVGGLKWKRKIEKNPRDARIGPWLRGEYDVLDDAVWRSKGACLYLVQSSDGHIRYVGISRNGVKHRWRTSPAYDAETMLRLPQDQLFHSQCWRRIEELSKANPTMSYEVRTIAHIALGGILSRIGPPLSGFLVLDDDGEGMCAGVERWLCNHSDGEFISWNTAMTGRG